jgi:hypothetical protein
MFVLWGARNGDIQIGGEVDRGYARVDSCVRCIYLRMSRDFRGRWGW